MVRLLVIAFLFAHGVLHPLMWATPVNEEKPPPFDLHRSWVLRAAHVAAAPAFSASVRLAWLTGALFCLSAAGLAIDVSWWTAAALAGALVGLVLKVGWFHPWLSLGVVLDVAVAAAITVAWPGSLF